MKTDALCRVFPLAVCLGHITFAGFMPAGEARLFPDLTLRFPVGDPNASNPISANEGPKTLAAADMNGDGLADVIVGNLDGSVSVLLGRTNGTLSEQILVPATGLLSNCSLRAVAVADFNGDGKLDVAAADIAGESVIVLLGNGDGTLLPFFRLPLGPARALAVADFNRDGKKDLLVACSPANCEWCDSTSDTNAASRFLCILDGHGDGTFAPPRFVLTPGTGACFYDVEAADLDGDGAPEALSLDFTWCTSPSGQVFPTRRIQIFANDGAGGFSTDTPDRVLETAGEGPRSFRLAYLDERLVGGRPPPGASLDLIVACRDSSTLDVFLNTGGLDFTDPISYSAGDTPRDVAVGDLDGDGYADLVVVNRNANSISVMRGLGNGLFAAPALEYPTGVSPRQVVLADINGDGVLDAVVNNRVSGDISIFLGQAGLAGFLVPGGWYPAGLSPVSVVAQDFNHDGYPDVAVANLRSHDVRVRLNQGDGRLGTETIYPVNFEPAMLAVGDVNLDGHPDLVVTCLGSIPNMAYARVGSLVTLLGNGDGTFRAPITTGLTNVTQQPYWLRLGDLDGDGVLDAVIGAVRGDLLVFRGLTNGSFAEGVRVGWPGTGRPLGVALGDFDRDGRLDIATSRGKVFLNDGHFFDGTDWTNNQWIGPTRLFNAGTQAWATECADLDGDTIPDLMVALTFRNPDPIAVLYGLGDGNFANPRIYEGPDVGAVALVAQDMDGDGIKDLVVGNRCAATVIIMRGLGDRSFAYREIIQAYSVESVAVADMNRDGRPDVIGVGGGLWVLLNGGERQLVPPSPANMAGVPERAGLFINEIMALNQQFHVTNNTTPDWIELYNHAPVSQSLAGWALAQYTADGDTNLWRFPSTNAVEIGPWGHLVVYCRRNPGAVPGLYATFELSSDGENLALLDPSGAQVDYVRFPAMPADVSYARVFDGARFFAYNPAPTLGTANQRPSNLDPIAERKDPYVGPGGSSLGLNARLFDDVAIAYAAVCYRVAGSNAFTELPLFDDGQHGDKAPNDGYYGVILPSLPAGATIEYYVRAIDIEGQVTTSPGNPNNTASLHRVVVPSSNPAVRLSELVAANQTGLRDERGQYEDWIEVVNTGLAPIRLDEFALSRDYFNHGSAWYFPSNRWLGPGERAVVFCDDQPRQGPLHATFKLLRSGDRVFLIQTNDWHIVDSLCFEEVPVDTSFGVANNGTEAQILAWPTPGQENIPVPPRRDPAGPAPEIFWRLAPDQDGISIMALRWWGNTNATYHVQGSDDLRSWQPADSTPRHLGLGLFEWKEVAAADRRFYRVVSSP